MANPHPTEIGRGSLSCFTLMESGEKEGRRVGGETGVSPRCSNFRGRYMKPADGIAKSGGISGHHPCGSLGEDNTQGGSAGIEGCSCKAGPDMALLAPCGSLRYARCATGEEI